MLHRALRGEADTRRVVWPESQAETETSTPAADPPTSKPDFFRLSVNALGLSILLGLTLWLAQGGADQLRLLLKGRF